MLLSMDEEIKTDDFTEFVPKRFERVDEDVAVIVLKIHHDDFGYNKKSFDFEILGKTLTEWVNIAFDTCPVLELECSEYDEIVDIVRPYLSDKRYTAVFYADTPLLTRQTFISIVDYAKSKGMNVCKLERGYVFKTDYLRTAEKIYSTTIPNLDFKEDFLKVDNLTNYKKASEIIKSRILNFHLKNGVQILDFSSVSIDADVIIGENVVIYPQNVLQGKTVVGNDCVLKVGNVITNSAIGNGCQLLYDVIESSKIPDGKMLEPFTYVSNGEVRRK